MKTTLTVLESKVVNYLKNCDTYNDKHYSCVEDIASSIGVAVKIARGIVVSLVNKGVVDSQQDFFSNGVTIIILQHTNVKEAVKKESKKEVKKEAPKTAALTTKVVKIVTKEPEPKVKKSEVDYDYPYIRVWGEMMGSYPYYIENQIALAKSLKAPKDTIYFNDKYPMRFKGVSNPKVISLFASKGLVKIQ